MTEPIFDHERLDVCRLSIEYVAFSYRIAKSLSGMNRPARDQWLRAAQSIPLNIASSSRSLEKACVFVDAPLLASRGLHSACLWAGMSAGRSSATANGAHAGDVGGAPQSCQAFRVRVVFSTLAGHRHRSSNGPPAALPLIPKPQISPPSPCAMPSQATQASQLADRPRPGDI
jgi:hypothetical protein